MINLGDSHRLMLGVWRVMWGLGSHPLKPPPSSTLLITDNWTAIGYLLRAATYCSQMTPESILGITDSQVLRPARVVALSNLRIQESFPSILEDEWDLCPDGLGALSPLRVSGLSRGERKHMQAGDIR